uniref:PCNA-associated factor of 15 kDa n=1 Tax=Capra hircus TaxID=9925 RepID=A0A8C2XUW5_CAPHI
GVRKRANDCPSMFIKPADPYLGGFSPTTPKWQKGIGEFFRFSGLRKTERKARPSPPDLRDDGEQDFPTRPGWGSPGLSGVPGCKSASVYLFRSVLLSRHST